MLVTSIFAFPAIFPKTNFLRYAKTKDCLEKDTCNMLADHFDKTDKISPKHQHLIVHVDGVDQTDTAQNM